MQCSGHLPRVYDSHIFFDLVEQYLEIFVDEFFVYGNSFGDS